MRAAEFVVMPRGLGGDSERETGECHAEAILGLFAGPKVSHTSQPDSFMPPGIDRCKERGRSVALICRIASGTLLALMLLADGCAFDVVHVKQQPASFAAAADSAGFVLNKEVKAKLGTGFPTILKAHTAWERVGTTEFGDVYSTKDQIVKVEASNIHEAYIVVIGHTLVGFYLPVEKTFAPLSHPIPLVINQP